MMQHMISRTNPPYRTGPACAGSGQQGKNSQKAHLCALGTDSLREAGRSIDIPAEDAALQRVRAHAWCDGRVSAREFTPAHACATEEIFAPHLHIAQAARRAAVPVSSSIRRHAHRRAHVSRGPYVYNAKASGINTKSITAAWILQWAHTFTRPPLDSSTRILGIDRDVLTPTHAADFGHTGSQRCLYTLPAAMRRGLALAAAA